MKNLIGTIDLISYDYPVYETIEPGERYLVYGFRGSSGWRRKLKLEEGRLVGPPGTTVTNDVTLELVRSTAWIHDMGEVLVIDTFRGELEDDLVAINREYNLTPDHPNSIELEQAWTPVTSTSSH